MEYYLDPTLQYPFSQPTRHSGKNQAMQVLEHVFDPNGTPVPVFEDCILVSLDIEYESSTQRMQQVGLAGLDAREIQKADLEEPIIDIISSRLLIFGIQKKSRGAYLFGDPEKHRSCHLASLLRPCFETNDTQNIARLRNIVLVGHGIRTDIEVIRLSSGLNLLELPMIKALIDTSPLINTVYRIPGHGHSLRCTCTYLGMYRRNMHNAGNDAMYTLKALLLLFHHYKDQKLFYELMDGPTDRMLLYECQLEAIKKIGRWNNGIGKFGGKRKRKSVGDVPDWKERRSQDPDLLNLEGGPEEGYIDQFFHSEW